jgi:ankyrin repeat protein
MNTPFYSAVHSNNFYFLNKLVEKGCNIHHMGIKKANALYFSVMFGKPETTLYLIEKGLDINI